MSPLLLFGDVVAVTLGLAVSAAIIIVPITAALVWLEKRGSR